uniref:Uncharacterized protein n=1 Tax=Panagrolaimus sp. JU765 TaxID=591449 RepID=A0AC34QFN2_9BILA
MFSGGGSMSGSNKTIESTTTTGGLSGSSTTPQSGFGSTLIDAGPEGTTIPFEPLMATDTMIKNDGAKNISTKLMCVTGMKEYESRSLEELRVFDYEANRKGP